MKKLMYQDDETEVFGLVVAGHRIGIHLGRMLKRKQGE